MNVLIKLFLMVCIIIGGISLMHNFIPKYIGMIMFHLGQYAITGELCAVAVLFWFGIVAVNFKH